MATVPVDICNMALANIGQPSIQALEGPTSAHRACKLRYDEARKEAQSAALWNFASMYREGTPVAIAAKKPYTRVFQYPPDALRIFDIEHLPGTPPPPFEVTARPDTTGRVIHCSLEKPVFIYTKSVEDIASFDQDFIQALAWLLASKIAMPVTKSLKLQQEAFKMWIALKSQAMANDHNEEQPDTDQLASYQEVR